MILGKVIAGNLSGTGEYSPVFAGGNHFLKWTIVAPEINSLDTVGSR